VASAAIGLVAFMLFKFFLSRHLVQTETQASIPSD
jgi:hypothetical protein